ncbi:hypothetical protein BCON_0033g00150 [Botryotinia convoluta]|uniref:Uncharacterized protein n=1 Tax=Botryotinia convoluta TaxID=54673 RepID=A0A4Z1IV86_9HELO|nr:hypothetical protein BCON_0033g00150 [Botryotinia convoluta]
MVVLPSSSGYRPNKGVKREHDPDQIHDFSSKSPNATGTSDNHTHQHKKKKSHHPQNQTEQSGGGKKKKKSKHKSSQSQQQEDALMSGGLGDMSVELGEPILPPPRDSQLLIPKMPKAMEVKHAKMNEDGGGGKKKKNKTVHFEEPSSNYRPPHVVDEEEEAETERFEINGDSAQRETSTLPVRSHSPILPPTSSPILPPTRPKRSSSHGPPPPILPQASPSRMNPLYVPPTISTPILPPASPFRKRHGSTGNAFSQPPPIFSREAPSPQATQPTPAKPTPTKSAEPKPKDDEWEVSTGKIRAMIDDPMEKDAQREENVAFSSNYIQSPMRKAQGINVGGVNFNIWHIKNRETFIFKSKSTGLQVCSVAQGSIWVFLGIEKFRISKGGMWRIREGDICSAKNQGGHECILHITSILSASTLVNQ